LNETGINELTIFSVVAYEKRITKLESSASKKVHSCVPSTGSRQFEIHSMIVKAKRIP
jgi:hypothetical protein